MRRGAPVFRRKRGEGYVPVCVVSVLLALLLSTLLQFVASVGAVVQVRENTRTVLDSHVTDRSIEIYDAIKQGRDDCSAIAAEMFSAELSAFCTFEENGDFLYHYDSDGNADYRLSRPQLRFDEENRLKLRCSFTVYFPLYLVGRQVGTAEIPVTVTSRLTSKIQED